MLYKAGPFQKLLNMNEKYALNKAKHKQKLVEEREIAKKGKKGDSRE